MCKADACFHKECLGDCQIEAATAATLSDPVLVLGWPGLFLFKVNDVCQKLETHWCILFSVGVGS